ncbi:glutathione S-transferase [Xylariaceae sp. FL0016]|nr:glutathione S-transferase [Xylariaceae sp. FL0016]
MANQEPRLFLHDHPVSSYAQKVRIALRHKGIPFDHAVPAHLGSGQRNGALLAANPRQEVPALVDGDVSVFDSTIILEYLEDKYPEPALLPPRRDPAARARARMIEDVTDCQYEAVNWAYGEVVWWGRGEEEGVAETVKEQVGLHTRDLQAWLAEKLGAGPFFGGEKLGWADCAVAPIVHRSVAWGMGPAEGSALQLWHARVSEVPSVKETFAEFDAAARAMEDPKSGLKGVFKSGGRKREYRDHRLEFMLKAGGNSIVQSGLRDQNIRFSWPRPDPPK